jgi:peptidoglycan/xylan/chitin deacetylase (PgdA/CDA1 family)
MKMWDWNVDTMDWKYQRTNPHQILVNTINGLKRVNKNRPIVILMHVTKGTASVLPQVIDYLYSKGYQLPAYDPSKQVIMNFWNDGRL